VLGQFSIGEWFCTALLKPAVRARELVTDESAHEHAQFQKTIPTEILWTALGRLFEDRIPTLSNDDFN
jgi:hypothetical protein